MMAVTTRKIVRPRRPSESVPTLLAEARRTVEPTVPAGFRDELRRRLVAEARRGSTG